MLHCPYFFCRGLNLALKKYTSSHAIFMHKDTEGKTISCDLTWNKHVENMVAKTQSEESIHAVSIKSAMII